MVRDPYSILGVPRETTHTDIATAYRRLANESHHDNLKTRDAIVPVDARPIHISHLGADPRVAGN